MQRKPIGLTVPYREVGYKEKSGWVGLMAKDWNEIAYSSDFRAGAEWAEAKLKEKNAQEK